MESVMITYDELNTQNDKITELSNVLATLIKDRSLCDSETCCDIFYSYMDHVNKHMQLVESNLYSSLLGASSVEAQVTVDNFMSNSQTIKRIMNSYVKKWCDKKNHSLSIGNKHDTFLRETDEMFTMILNRIQDEMENLYPMVRSLKAA